MESAVLVFTTLFCFMFLMMGGVIGWLFKTHSVQSQWIQSQMNVDLHPEFLDEHGNVIPDEILAVRFENDMEDLEDEEP